MVSTEERLDRLEKALRRLVRIVTVPPEKDDVLQILDPKHKRDQRFDGG